MTPVPKPTPVLREPKKLTGKPHVLPAHVRNFVLARDRMTCRWCQRPGGALVVHHIQRRSQGGKDVGENLVSLHALCHAHIHDNPAEGKARGFLR